jgi:hypothetical protein
MVESGLLVEAFEEADSNNSITADGIFPPGKDADNLIGSSLHPGHISEPFPYAHNVVVEVTWLCSRRRVLAAIVAGDEKATTLKGKPATNKG